MFEALVRVMNYNVSQMLSSQLAGFLAETSTSTVPLVTRLTEGEPTPRNKPPNFFNPPIPIPNNWVNRSTAVYVTGVVDPFPTCDQIEGMLGAKLTSAGYVTDWGSCTIASVATSSATSTVPPIGVGASSAGIQGQDWRRSESDFNKTVIPCLVIAIVIFVIGIVLIILNSCKKTSEEAREAHVINKLNRMRMINNRMLHNKDAEATFYPVSDRVLEANARLEDDSDTDAATVPVTTPADSKSARQVMTRFRSTDEVKTYEPEGSDAESRASSEGPEQPSVAETQRAPRPPPDYADPPTVEEVEREARAQPGAGGDQSGAPARLPPAYTDPPPMGHTET